MCRDHERQTVIQLGENPAEVAVPGMAMHEVGIDVRGIEIGAAPHGFEDGAQCLWTSESFRVQFESADG